MQVFAYLGASQTATVTLPDGTCIVPGLSLRANNVQGVASRWIVTWVYATVDGNGNPVIHVGCEGPQPPPPPPQ